MTVMVLLMGLSFPAALLARTLRAKTLVFAWLALATVAQAVLADRTVFRVCYLLLAAGVTGFAVWYALRHRTPADGGSTTAGPAAPSAN